MNLLRRLLTKAQPLNLVKAFRNYRERLREKRVYYVKVFVKEQRTGDMFGPAMFTIKANSRQEAADMVLENLRFEIDDVWPMRKTLNGLKK